MKSQIIFKVKTALLIILFILLYTVCPTWADITLSGHIVSSNASTGRYDLEWTDSVGGADHYDIYDQNTASLLATVPGTSSSHSLTGLTGITTYEFYVEAVNGGGGSLGTSNILRSTVLPCFYQPLMVDFEPNNDLSAAVWLPTRDVVPSPHSYGNINTSVDEDWYQVYAYAGQTISLSIEVVDATGTQVGWTVSNPSGTPLHQTTGLIPSNSPDQYSAVVPIGGGGYYRIRVWNSNGNNVTTRYNMDVSVTPQNDTTCPSGITNLTATPISSTEIELSWDPITDDIGPVGYGIGDIGPANTFFGFSRTSTYRVKNLTPNTSYTFGVGGYDAGGNISMGSAVTETTLPISFHTVTASAGVNGSIAPSGSVSVNNGDTQAFSVTPNGGYQAVMSGTCGGNLNGNAYITHPITSDCSVVANFNPIGSNQPLLPGNNVQVNVPVSLPSGGTGTVTVTFNQVDTGGVLNIIATDTALGGSTPTGFQFLGTYYDVTYSGSFSGYIYVTLPYVDSGISPGSEHNLRLFHWEGSWRDVTYSIDTVNNKITGRVTSLSPFGMGYPLGYTTGANENMIALIAILAISVGLFIVRRSRWVKA